MYWQENSIALKDLKVSSASAAFSCCYIKEKKHLNIETVSKVKRFEFMIDFEVICV